MSGASIAPRQAGPAREGEATPRPKTVHNVHVCLRRALETAREDGLIKTDPAAGAHRAPKDGPEMLTWSEEEVVTFLESVAGERDAAFWRLALDTGMRKGELLGLRRRDVDLNAGLIHVRQQWSRQQTSLYSGRPRPGRRSEPSRSTKGPPEPSRPPWRPGVRAAQLGQGLPARPRPRLLPAERRARRPRRPTPPLRAPGETGRRHPNPVPRHAPYERDPPARCRRGRQGRERAPGQRSVNVTLTIYHHVKPRAKASVASKIGAILDKSARSVRDSIADSQMMAQGAGSEFKSVAPEHGLEP